MEFIREKKVGKKYVLTVVDLDRGTSPHYKLAVLRNGGIIFDKLYDDKEYTLKEYNQINSVKKLESFMNIW